MVVSRMRGLITSLYSALITPDPVFSECTVVKNLHFELYSPVSEFQSCQFLVLEYFIIPMPPCLHL